MKKTHPQRLLGLSAAIIILVTACVEQDESTSSANLEQTEAGTSQPQTEAGRDIEAPRLDSKETGRKAVGSDAAELSSKKTLDTRLPQATIDNLANNIEFSQDAKDNALPNMFDTKNNDKSLSIKARPILKFDEGKEELPGIDGATVELRVKTK